MEPLPANGPDFGALGEEAEFVEVEPEAKQEILENKDVSFCCRARCSPCRRHSLPQTPRETGGLTCLIAFIEEDLIANYVLERLATFRKVVSGFREIVCLCGKFKHIFVFIRKKNKVFQGQTQIIIKFILCPEKRVKLFLNFVAFGI